MLSTISDQMRQYLPNCPKILVEALMPDAQKVYNQEEFSATSLTSFRYGNGTRCSFSFMGQFSKNVTEYLPEPKFRQVEQADVDLRGLSQNGIKLILDDGTDKLSSVVENCFKGIKKACDYLKLSPKFDFKLPEEKECIAQYAQKCLALSPKTEMIYEMYMQGSQVCESLEVNGLSEKVVQCFEPIRGMEKLPLLSEVCNWDPPAYKPPELGDYQGFFTATAVGSLFLAYNRFSKQGICNKIAGVAMSAIALGSFAILVTS